MQGDAITATASCSFKIFPPNEYLVTDGKCVLTQDRSTDADSVAIGTATTLAACKLACDENTSGQTFDPIKRCVGYAFLEPVCNNLYIDEPFIGNGVVSDGKCYAVI